MNLCLYSLTEDEVMFTTETGEQRMIYNCEEHPFTYNENEAIKAFKLWCVAQGKVVP